MDRARQRTDKRLKDMERKMGRVYRTDPALVSIQHKFNEYMKMVGKKTRSLYVAYMREADEEKKAELKKEYASAVKALTLDAKEFQKIIKEFTEALAKANQKALEIANAEMRNVYVENYNQVASDCRKVGIKINGEE